MKRPIKNEFVLGKYAVRKSDFRAGIYNVYKGARKVMTFTSLQQAKDWCKAASVFFPVGDPK